MKIEVVDSFQRYGDFIQLKWQQRHSNSFSKHRANQVWNRFLIHASDTERIFHKYVLYFFLSPRKRISTTIFFNDAILKTRLIRPILPRMQILMRMMQRNCLSSYIQLYRRHCTNHLWKIRIIRICFRKETSTENSKS